MSNQPEVKAAVVEQPSPPRWFNVAYISLAVFAGPVALTLAVGLVAVCAVAVAGVLDIVRKVVGV